VVPDKDGKGDEQVESEDDAADKDGDGHQEVLAEGLRKNSRRFYSRWKHESLK